MQSNEMEFELSPSILNTPSLMTPNLAALTSATSTTTANGNAVKPSYNPLESMVTGEPQSVSHSNSSTIPTTSTETSASSSSDVKVSRIEDDLKKSVFTRQPTPSPFAAIATANGAMPKISYSNPTDDAQIPEIPSTADVVSALESLTNTSVGKYLSKPLVTDSTERELTALIADNARGDGSPTVNPGLMVSPKKIFLIRSQSIPEATSPHGTNNANPSQKFIELDGSNVMDDSIGNHSNRVNEDLSATNLHSNEISHNSTFSSTLNNRTDPVYSVPMRPESNTMQHPIIKQPTVLINAKREFPAPMTKSTPIIIPQAPLTNEVTSSDQLMVNKRQKTAPTTNNTSVVTFRPAATAASSATVPSAAHSPNTGGGSDDQRKKQIRDSNREAARRCRERRRQYIEQLEGNLEQSKAQIKQLSEKISRLERENLQYRALLAETKLLHPAARLAPNETLNDYINVSVSGANELDLNGQEASHQTDPGLLQRNFLNRNNL